MEFEIDETCCGLLCQHPTCWDSVQRLNRGKPHHASTVQPPSPRHDDLPTQKVVNLLAEYGDDPYDRYPSSRYTHGSHYSSHRSSQASHGGRMTQSHPSSATIRDSCPRLKTPMVTPASFLQSSSLMPQPVPPTQPQPVKMVEVQEVFDLEDLQRKWQDTFVTRQRYVWVPSKDKNRHSLQEPNVMSQSNGSIRPRDLTELMVPQRVGWERHDPKMRRNMGSPKTPQQGLSSYSRTSCKSPNREYYGDLVDRDRLTEALTRAFPRLETENSTLSMAYGDVLQQHKIQIHPDRPPRPKATLVNLKPLQPLGGNKPLYLMDVGVNPPGHQLPADLLPTTFQPSQPKPVHVIPIHVPHTEPKPMPHHDPLPAIPAEEKDDGVRIASVSLGLPQLPPGVKITRPFNYSTQEFDFTLGPVPEPSPFDTHSKQKGKLDQSQGRPCSPVLSDHGSSIVVTMPTVPTDQSEINGQPRNNKIQTTGKREFTESGIADESRPLHAVSPSQSTKVPNPPACTPAMRQTSTFTRGTPSPTKAHHDKAHHDVYGEPITGVPVTGIAIPIAKPLPASPEPHGVLETIRESEPDEPAPLPADCRLRELPKSRRSVRFAPDVPQQTSPTDGHSLVNNNSATTPDILTVHRDSSSAQTRDQETSSPDPSWPQVNEADYDHTPIGSPINPPSSSAENDQSVIGQFDDKSHPSELGSLLLSRESTRLASRESGKASILRECMGESPGPPPPSPEPKDLLKPKQHPDQDSSRSNGSHLLDNSILLDDLDSDSGMTISAKPPSNLDDFSRIQTPATPQTRADLTGLTPRDDIIPEVASTLENDASSVAVTIEADNEAGTARTEGVTIETVAASEGSQSGSMPMKSDIMEPTSQQALPVPEVDIMITPGTRPPSESPDTDRRPADGDSTEDSVVPQVQPQGPGYTSLDHPDSPEGQPPDMTDGLDTFQATDDMFKAELEQELGRLEDSTNVEVQELDCNTGETETTEELTQK